MSKIGGWIRKLRRPRRGTITVLAFAASLLSTAALAWASWGAGALNANIRVDPSIQHVLPGDTFTINMVSNADVQTSGVEADLAFDPAQIEVIDVGASTTDWQGAAFFLGVAPQGKAEAIAEANTTGSLLNIGRYISPGGTLIAPGPRVFAVITMRAKPGAAFGTFPITLSGVAALDGDYSGVHTSENEGEVVITGVLPTSTIPGAPTSTSTATPTASATSTSTPVTPTSTSTVGADTPTSTGTPAQEPTETPGPGQPGVLRVDPETRWVNDGDTFNMSIVQFVELQMFGVQSDVTFNAGFLELLDVTGGSGYPTGQLTVGVPGQTKVDAIAEANATGTLRNLQVFQSEAAIDGGENTAFVLAFRARPETGGLSPIALKNVFFYGVEAVSVTRVGALVEVLGPLGSPTPTPTTPPTSTYTHTATPTVTFTPTVPVPTDTVGPTSTGPVVAPTSTYTATRTATATVLAATSTATTVAPSATATRAATATATVAALATNAVAALPSATALVVTATSGPSATSTTAAGATATATTASGTATATTAAASGSPSATATVDAASADSTISVSPATITAPPGAEFSVILVQQAGFVTTGAEADLQFDPTLVQVVSVEKSTAYAKASLVMGVAPQTPAEAIAEANTSGRLKNVGTFFVPGPGANVPAGQAEFVRIKLKTSATASNTTTALKILDLEMLNEEGVPLTVAGADGQLTIQAGAAVPTAVGPGSTVAGASAAPNAATRLPNAGVSDSFGELNWALLVSLVAMLASGGALVGSLYQKQPR